MNLRRRLRTLSECHCVEAGLVTVTLDDDGQPFDWSKVTGKVMRIHAQEHCPRNAYVAVEYRGWWYYIADNDQSSKSTFSLLNILYSLQSANRQRQITCPDAAGGQVKRETVNAGTGVPPRRSRQSKPVGRTA